MLLIIGLSIGFLLGAVLAWLFARIKHRSILLEKTSLLNNQYLSLQTSMEAAEHNANLRITEKVDTIQLLNTKIDSIQTQYQQAIQQVATKDETIKFLNEQVTTKQAEMNEWGTKFKNEFEVLANKILETKSEKFTALNQTNIKSILEPLNKDLKEFKTQMETTEQARIRTDAEMKTTIKHLSEQNMQMSEDAKNLTKALKGESKTQGKWGELILQAVIDKTNLTKNEHYFLEYELKDDNDKHLRLSEEGKKMRPDLVIKFSPNKLIIVDSKMSINAYLRFVETQDKEELKHHLADIKSHIETLYNRGYYTWSKSVGFVFMFIPYESAYGIALQQDPRLWEYAYDKKVILVCPSNLVACLKLIEQMWRIDNVNKNAERIAEQGGKLYDKFCGFLETFQKIGFSIDASKKSYDEALGKLKEGKGNVLTLSNNLKEMGSKTTKTMPLAIANLLEEDEGYIAMDEKSA